MPVYVGITNATNTNVTQYMQITADTKYLHVLKTSKVTLFGVSNSSSQEIYSYAICKYIDMQGCKYDTIVQIAPKSDSCYLCFNTSTATKSNPMAKTGATERTTDGYSIILRAISFVSDNYLFVLDGLYTAQTYSFYKNSKMPTYFALNGDKYIMVHGTGQTNSYSSVVIKLD